MILNDRGAYKIINFIGDTLKEKDIERFEWT
jgi:hypothetical protein